MKPTTLNNKCTLLKVLLTVFPHCVLFLSSCKDGLIINTSFVTGNKSVEQYVCNGSLTHQFQQSIFG